MATQRDYYDVLGVDRSASLDQIKKAYRQKALEFHPDRNKSADAEAKFKEVNQAYEVLSNPQKRQTYDQFGHAGGPFRYTYTTDNMPDIEDLFGGFSDPFDIFASFFGGESPFRRGPQKPHYSFKLNFLEAALGTEKSLVHQGKKHTIKVPAGASDGTRIRYPDFDVSFDVQPHPTFKRQGYDLIVDREIPFTQAILGATIEVPTLDRPLKLKIRPGTQPGTVLRLGSQGIKYLNSHRRGDLYIRLHISFPRKLTSKQKDLLKQLDQTL